MSSVPSLPGTVPGTVLSSVCAAPFRGPAQSHSDPLSTFDALTSPGDGLPARAEDGGPDG